MGEVPGEEAMTTAEVTAIAKREAGTAFVPAMVFAFILAIASALAAGLYTYSLEQRVQQLEHQR